MQNKNLIRFVQGLILLPVISNSFSAGNMDTGAASPSVLAKINIEAKSLSALNKAEELEAKIKEERAAAIDAYFEERGMPLKGTGMKMVEEAEKNGLDWRLLAAISVRESTGGKFACKKATYSAFGWGSCKINFTSYEHNIEVVARNLGGNNPNTAYHYAGKDIRGILQAYNPPSVVPRYADQVINIMNAIGPESLGLADAQAPHDL